MSTASKALWVSSIIPRACFIDKAPDFWPVDPVAEGELLGAIVALAVTAPSHVVMFNSSSWFPAVTK